MQSSKKSHTKLILSLGLLVLTVRTIIAILLPYRATTDEALVFSDIGVALSGELTSPSYFSGMGYQTGSAVILKVIDGTLWDLNILSPMLGSIAFVVISTYLYLILRDSLSDSAPIVSVLIAPLSLFVFAGFLNRLSESSHKAYTLTFLFAGLYTSYAAVTRNSHKMTVLSILFAVAISLMNYIWGIIFGSIIMISLLISYRSRSLSHPGPFAIPISTFGIAFYLPRIDIHRTYFIETIPALISGLLNRGAISTTSEAAGATVVWPLINILGFEITVWVFYTLGIAVVVLLSVISGLLFLIEISQDRTVDSLQSLYIAVSLVTGLLIGFFLFAGDLATLKRVAPILGSISAVYFISRIYDVSLGTISLQRQSVIVIGVAILLILTAPLAIPRMALDESTGSPYNYYASDSQISQVLWINEVGAIECRADEQVVDKVARKHIRVGLTTTPTLFENKIYHSGTGASSYCQSITRG